MDTNTLRAIVEAEKESHHIAMVKRRAHSFAFAYERAQKVMGYAECSARKKVDGDWLEFYAPFRDIMFMRNLKVWGLGKRGYQKEPVLKLFTGRVLIVAANSVNWARIRVRYQ